MDIPSSWPLVCGDLGFFFIFSHFSLMVCGTVMLEVKDHSPIPNTDHGSSLIHLWWHKLWFFFNVFWAVYNHFCLRSLTCGPEDTVKFSSFTLPSLKCLRLSTVLGFEAEIHSHSNVSCSLSAVLLWTLA